MAPIRRYLRITRYSVLEVRIYLDNPALAETWLLKPSNPSLPRVIEAVRPFVLPKLREENEKGKKKGGKKNRGVKDVVRHDEFDVSIFLTETSTTHTLLTKQKVFADKPRIKSTSNKMGIGGFFGNKTDKPIDVDDNEPPAVLLEEDAEETRLEDIPEAPRSGVKRSHTEDEPVEVSSEDDSFGPVNRKAPKRKRDMVVNSEEQSDDKKKMALNTQYEGFSIYGRVLCLIVKRKGVKKPVTGGAASGSEMLESWVSTQANNENVGDMDDDG